MIKMNSTVVCAQCGDKTWLTSAISATRSADLQCHPLRKTWRSSQRPSYIITSTTTSRSQTQAVLPHRPIYSFLTRPLRTPHQPQSINC